MSHGLISAGKDAIPILLGMPQITNAIRVSMQLAEGSLSSAQHCGAADTQTANGVQEQ